VDVLPTVLEACGEGDEPQMQGRSFLGLFGGEPCAPRERVFTEKTFFQVYDPMRAVRTATHKYILNLHPERTFTTHITGCRPPSPHHLPFWDSWVAKAKSDPRAAAVVRRYMHRPKEELYDIVKDPFEQHNLADDPAHTDSLTALRERLTAWRKQQGDPTLT